MFQRPEVQMSGKVTPAAELGNYDLYKLRYGRLFAVANMDMTGVKFDYRITDGEFDNLHMMWKVVW